MPKQCCCEALLTSATGRRGPVGAPQAPPKPDYAAVKAAISDMLEKEDYDDGSYGPVFVRLAWHASGTYDKNTNTGGSNGATMRWVHNASLQQAQNRPPLVRVQSSLRMCFRKQCLAAPAAQRVIILTQQPAHAVARAGLSSRQA